MASQEAVARATAFIESLETDVRRVADGEWGLTLDSAGYRLDVGVQIRGELLRVQAAVLPANVIDPHQLLFWNRQAPFVSFAENQEGEVWVVGELPLEALSTETLDRFLGLVLASSTRAREFAIQHVWG
ncbi:MAG: YbjN domain-containing protein [Solirubrobacterales bacterium]|nr:YbjN domain-containing protein [Solirubrobacterales bacterium]